MSPTTPPPSTDAGKRLLTYVEGLAAQRWDPLGVRIAHDTAVRLIEDVRREAIATERARLRAAVLALPATPFFTSGDDEAMCPNCVTPWKCNGPHELPEREPDGFEVDRAAVLRELESPTP